ncbi:MAG: carbon monoxide dehydrogenase subunit G [Alphaproteobacteria bacterium]
MDMQGEYRIPAPRETVWEALNDPEVLKECITGCQELNRTDDGGFDAKVKAKVGPVSATFSGSVRFENVNAPESYTIVGEGKGGAAGFAKGGADVSLAEDGDETILTYTVNAQVGGKLAQIGARLVDSTAKKYANEFFEKFAEIAAARAAGDTPGGETAAAAPDQEAAPDSAPVPPQSDPPPPPNEPATDVQDAAARAAIDAVDQKGPKPVLKPFQWIMLLVIILAGFTLFFGGGEPPSGN